MNILIIKAIFLILIYPISIFAADFKNDGNPTVKEVIDKTTVAETPGYENDNDSASLAQNFLDEVGLGEGPNGDLFVAVGTAQINEEDPATNPDFLMMREMKANEAALEAKRVFIEYIRTEISANDLITMPESPLGTAFDDEKKAVQNKINKAVRKYKKALRALDKAEHKKNAGLTYDDLAKEGIIAKIQQIKPNFDPKKIEKQKIDNYKKAKAELEATQVEIDTLTEKAKKIRGQLSQENISTTQTFAQMSVVGLVPIASFESWDGEIYQTTQIAIWTNNEEKRIRALYSGQNVKFEPGTLPLRKFVRSTDWSTTQGARKFFDEKGDFWLIGVGSFPIKGKGSSDMRAAKGQAQLSAQKQIAYTLYSEAQSKRLAQNKLQEVESGKLDGSKENLSVSSFAETISQNVDAKSINGMAQILGKKYKHPISGQTMYVSVYGLSSKNVREAKLIEESQAIAAQEQIIENQKSKGIKAGIEKAISETKADKSSFKKGKEEGYSKAKRNSSEATSGANNTGTNTKGSFKGGGTTSGAFK